MKIYPIFAWYDFWVGFFWHRSRRILYFFPFPCFGFAIQFGTHRYSYRDWLKLDEAENLIRELKEITLLDDKDQL